MDIFCHTTPKFSHFVKVTFSMQSRYKYRVLGFYCSKVWCLKFFSRVRIVWYGGNGPKWYNDSRYGKIFLPFNSNFILISCKIIAKINEGRQGLLKKFLQWSNLIVLLCLKPIAHLRLNLKCKGVGWGAFQNIFRAPPTISKR